MTARELMEWSAYEQVYGPALIHERIDRGFALVATVVARVFGSRGRQPDLRDFMPPWYRELTAEQTVTAAFEALLRQADHAHD